MVRAKKNKEVLASSALSDLKREKQEIEGTIKAIESEGVGDGTRGRAAIDVDRLKSEVKYLDTQIREGSAPDVRGKQKDDIHREAEELGKKIQEGMPTYDEMQNPAKNPGAIQKNRNWERDKQHLVLRWKNLMRILEPNDPTASNVERLRHG